MARPSEYTQDKADDICEKMADGMSLREICRIEGQPHISTVLRWVAAHKEFREQYTRAREVQADTIFEEILDIVDNSSNDWIARNDPENPGWIANHENINRARLRMDARKWMAGKMRPKVYGDKITNELTGPNGSALAVQIVRFADDPATE